LRVASISVMAAVVLRNTFIHLAQNKPVFAQRRCRSEEAGLRQEPVLPHLSSVWELGKCADSCAESETTCTPRPGCDFGRTDASTSSTPVPKSPGPTTMMLRNIPNSLTEAELLAFLHRFGFQGAYNAVHLPVDKRSGCNRGYAFINFVGCSSFCGAMRDLRGQTFPGKTSSKVTEVDTAKVQGFEALDKVIRECAERRRLQRLLAQEGAAGEEHGESSS